ncbi:MAG: hypothetical protein LBG43_10970 [Treponema sp.]|nr:hypothetical protein [Treponema sp.]
MDKERLFERIYQEPLRESQLEEGVSFGHDFIWRVNQREREREKRQNLEPML